MAVGSSAGSLLRAGDFLGLAVSEQGPPSGVGLLDNLPFSFLFRYLPFSAFFSLNIYLLAVAGHWLSQPCPALVCCSHEKLIFEFHIRRVDRWDLTH